MVGILCCWDPVPWNWFGMELLLDMDGVSRTPSSFLWGGIFRADWAGDGASLLSHGAIALGIRAFAVREAELELELELEDGCAVPGEMASFG